MMMNQAKIKTCPKCHNQFMNMAIELINTIAFEDLDVLCPNCSNEKHKKSKSKHHTIKDYYFDAKGNCVFTAAYHLQRGYCCRNNCRHCPY
jgi:hypothetical protein